jgi:hypothetical protein
MSNSRLLATFTFLFVMISQFSALDFNGRLFLNGLKWEVKSRFIRCEEHLYKRLRRSVRRSVGPPRCAITWKTKSFFISYVAIASRRGGGRGNWIRRDSIMSRFHYVAIPSHLGIRRSPCFMRNGSLRILLFQSNVLQNEQIWEHNGWPITSHVTHDMTHNPVW